MATRWLLHTLISRGHARRTAVAIVTKVTLATIIYGLTYGGIVTTIGIAIGYLLY